MYLLTFFLELYFETLWLSVLVQEVTNKMQNVELSGKALADSPCVFGGHSLIQWWRGCFSHVRLWPYGPQYWNGLPFPTLGDLPDPGIKPASLHWQVGSLLLVPRGKPGGEVIMKVFSRIRTTIQGRRSLLHSSFWVINSCLPSLEKDISPQLIY